MTATAPLDTPAPLGPQPTKWSTAQAQALVELQDFSFDGA